MQDLTKDIRDNEAHKKIREAVEAALDATWTPKETIEAVKDWWVSVLEEKISSDRKEFERV